MRAVLIYLLFFIGSNCISQIDYNFYLHLQANKLFKEQHYYLESLKNRNMSADSVNFLFTKLYLQQKNDSLFFKYYSLSDKIFNKDSNLLRHANYHYLKHSSASHQALWFEKINTSKDDSLNSSIIVFYKSLNQNHKSDINQFNDYKLKNDLRKYNKLKRKSPVLAACLSAVVPGLGKLYGQRPNSALVTFFSQGLSAYQAIESIKMYGVKNGFSIFSISFFSFFYASNIYGSFHDLISLKKQRQKQLLLDAEKYYYINYPAPLY